MNQRNGEGADVRFVFFRRNRASGDNHDAGFIHQILQRQEQRIVCSNPVSAAVTGERQFWKHDYVAFLSGGQVYELGMRTNIRRDVAFDSD